MAGGLIGSNFKGAFELQPTEWESGMSIWNTAKVMKLSTDFQHFSTILIATHTTFVDSWRRMWMEMSGIFCCDPISICVIWVNESYWNVSWRPNLSLHFGYIVSSWSEWKQWAPNPSLFKTKIFPTAHHLHSIQFAYTRTPSYLLCTVDRYIYIEASCPFCQSDSHTHIIIFCHAHALRILNGRSFVLSSNIFVFCFRLFHSFSFSRSLIADRRRVAHHPFGQYDNIRLYFKIIFHFLSNPTVFLPTTYKLLLY